MILETGSVLQRLFQSVGLGLGLLTYINAAIFSPPEVVTADSGERIIRTTIEFGITEDINELIMQSNRIRIVYEADIYTKNDKIYQYRFSKEIKYISIKGNYVITSENGETSYENYEQSLLNLMTFELELTMEDPYALVLEAFIDLPEMDDPYLEDSLWNGTNPRIIYNFEEEP